MARGLESPRVVTSVRRCSVAVSSAAALAVLALVALAVLAVVPAAAQSAGDAASDLRSSDVTWEAEALESGVVTRADLQDIADAARQAGTSEAFVKVVVLGSPVSDWPSAGAYAEAVLDELGGQGRVIVYDTDEVGVASTVDTPDEIAAAELAAFEERATWASSVLAAVSALGAADSSAGPAGDGPAGSAGDGSGGGGFPWGLVLVGLAGVAVVMVLVVRSSTRKRRSGGRLADVGVDAQAVQRVRSLVDQAANAVIELSDTVELPSSPPEARQRYVDGAAQFAELQDDLEEADTRAELEAVYPQLVDTVWKLDTARALAEGRPPPDPPAPEPLFPVTALPPPPAPQPAAAGSLPPPAPPEPHYRSMSSSPWLTAASTAAMSILLSRGLARPPRRSHRAPAGDDALGAILGGFGGLSSGGRGSGRRSTGRRSSGGRGPSFGRGRVGRGMGRRR